MVKFALLGRTLLVAALGVVAQTTLAGVTVTGPIVGGKYGAPFNLPTFDLAKYGYVAEEFFVDGEAGSYELSPGTEQKSDGRWQLRRKPKIMPYRTRILVIRPSNPKRFNGIVIANWQNAGAGFELSTVFEGEEYLRGYAWVGISAEQFGIDGYPGGLGEPLKEWDPQRYGSLNHPGEEYSPDVFSQVGLAIGPNRSSKVDPLGKLPVKKVVAVAASMAATSLRTYLNGVHPHHRVYDGYIIYTDFARSYAIPAAAGQKALPSAATRRATLLGVDTIIRTDLNVPVFVVNSETEAESYYALRQPNTDKFRFWEAAGASHANVPREFIGHLDKEIAPGFAMNALDSPNWIGAQPIYQAAVRHMQVWLTTGKAPPEAPLIEMTADKPPLIARDVNGNARGGIRLPDIAVATGEHRGAGLTRPSGFIFGYLFGFARELHPKDLARRYPNSSAYLSAYDQALKAVVDKGYVLPEDAAALRGAASAWAVKLDRKKE